MKIFKLAPGTKIELSGATATVDIPLGDPFFIKMTGTVKFVGDPLDFFDAATTPLPVGLAAEVFDQMTAAGYGMNLITGHYERTRQTQAFPHESLKVLRR